MTFNKKDIPTVLAKVKEATRDQHDDLEKIVDVMSNILTKERYKEMITDFYRFYSSIEGEISDERLFSIGIDAHRRRKTPLLERDIDALGADGHSTTEKFTDIPVLDTVPKMLGSLYVMEGATLGGQVITRHLRTQLGITPENGGAFFNSYGHEVGPMWKQFCSAVNTYAEQNGHEDEIIGSARATFDSFARCLREGRVAREPII